MKSTQAMRDRVRELMSKEADDYDRAVGFVLDDLEGLLRAAPRPFYPPGALKPWLLKERLMPPYAKASQKERS